MSSATHHFRCDTCGATVDSDSDGIIRAYNEHQVLHSTPSARAALAAYNSTVAAVTDAYAKATTAAELARTQGLKQAKLDYDNAIAVEG
jgi:hypothetical protein